jgi:hypothetical protein
MLLRQQREAASPPARDNRVIYELMRQMRGEGEGIEEAQDTPHED